MKKSRSQAGKCASPNRIVFVTWDEHCTRSENQSRHLGANLFSVSFARSVPTLLGNLIRYLISIPVTILGLWRRAPKVVFTTNQPIFLVLAVATYAKLGRIPFIIDSHSGAFNDSRWSWSIPLYKRCVSAALVNLNTNRHHRELVESWGGRSLIVADIPIHVDSVDPPDNAKEPYVAVVTSFSFDEPIEEIIETARRLSGINLYMTGNFRKLPEAMIESKPDNVHFTGFTTYAQYLGLLAGAIGVLVLTTRDNTMQRGAYEALSLAVPIITSDFAVLRESFADAAIYVDNTRESIEKAVRNLQVNTAMYREAAARQKLVREEHYQQVLKQLIQLCEDPDKDDVV